ncbi:MAG: hypothetical protein KKB20_00030 [Proteobacteria bacterium]|nr:hypothetical protein [Pseudomonadota bacterium]
MAQKKSLPPRTKRMNRTARLQSAKHWIPAYEGKNIVRGYKKRYAVDWECAIAELRMLGVNVPREYEKQIRTSLENERKAKQIKKQQAEESDWGMEGGHDDHFAYIAGFTSGGAPLGVTREDWGAREDPGGLKEIPPGYHGDDSPF